MKKLLIGILVITIVFSNSFAFFDIDSFAWAEDAINKWSEAGYISGYPDGSFCGNKFITRAEVISIVNKFNNSDVVAKKRPSKDVNYENWFFEDMAKASQIGLISVNEEGNLRPNDYATREEVMVILSKLFNISYSGNIELAKIKEYKDCYDVSSENYYRVAGIVEDGYVKGYDDGTLRPGDRITRAEFLCMINNIVNTVIKTGRYDNQAIVGNVVINGKNVVITNSEIRGKIFIMDGARDYEPTLINTRVSKGVNSRVGNIIIKDTDEFATWSEYEFNNPEEKDDPVIATLKYSDTDWTNDDVEVKVSFNESDVNVNDRSVVFCKNGEKTIEYEYKGKIMHLNAKVENIDKIKPVVLVEVQKNVDYATVTVTVEDDGLSPIESISCDEITNEPDKETGIIENVFTITKNGTYTVFVEDKAGNIGKAKFVVDELTTKEVTD